MAQQLAFASTAGARALVGVDEAGRGPLAGPVVAAAVILDDERPIAGLADSKRLAAAAREEIACAVRERARAFAVAAADTAEIDALNVLQASLLAMTRALAKLRVMPEAVRIDGLQVPRLPDPIRSFDVAAVVRGDESVPAISAASILAKVCRDRLMQRLHRRYPMYGFDRHKGYATPAHLAALAEFGPCPIHRKTFRPVRELLGTLP